MKGRVGGGLGSRTNYSLQLYWTVVSRQPKLESVTSYRPLTSLVRLNLGQDDFIDVVVIRDEKLMCSR